MASGIDFALLRDHLATVSSRFDVDWLPECDSTNTQLLARATTGAAAGLVLGAERQTAGRGRRGRRWHASPDCSLTFSLLWRLPVGAPLHGLSLAVGVAIAQGLATLGCDAIQLKWPNDIWLNGAKLGGVLVETAAQGGLVIGIGLNLRRDPAWQADVDQAFAALEDALPALPSREATLAAILCALAEVLDCFADAGFAPLREAWCARNALLGQAISVSSENMQERGICGQVSAEGALILTRPGLPELLINHGDVSLTRVQP